MRLLLLLASVSLFCVSTSPAEILTDKSPQAKIQALYEKVLTRARENPPSPGDIICIGSSHMQLWKSVKTDLAPLTVHNYGVGGSRMTHATDLFIDNLAIAFKPRAVILYEGSNDISAGSKPEDVLKSFQDLYRKLHTALPGTRLYVLSIVPSPGKRFDRIGDVRLTNELMRKECETQPWMTFLDITTPLIGADGQPKTECFIPGDIHMLPAGYAAWKSVIAPVIVPNEKSFEQK